MAGIEEARCSICGRAITDGRDICPTCNRALGLLGRSDENLRNALAYVQARMEVRPVGRPRKVVHRLRFIDEKNLEDNVRLAYVILRWNSTEVARRLGLDPATVRKIVEPVDVARSYFSRLFG